MPLGQDRDKTLRNRSDPSAVSPAYQRQRTSYELRDDVDEHVDIIAERVAQLDGIALGTIQTVAKTTSLPPYPTDIRKVEDHLRALVEHFGAVSKSAREAIDTADVVVV